MDRLVAAVFAVLFLSVTAARCALLVRGILSLGSWLRRRKSPAGEGPPSPRRCDCLDYSECDPRHSSGSAPDLCFVYRTACP
jgi:hypothetical protein